MEEKVILDLNGVDPLLHNPISRSKSGKHPTMPLSTIDIASYRRQVFYYFYFCLMPRAIKERLIDTTFAVICPCNLF